MGHSGSLYPKLGFNPKWCLKMMFKKRRVTVCVSQKELDTFLSLRMFVELNSLSLSQTEKKCLSG